jgi:hypothetical protein
MSNERLISDALLKTAPQLHAAVDANNSWQAAIKKKGARTLKYRNYERGDHDSNLTTQQRKLLNITADDSELNESNSNYCGIVVDMMAGRLEVSEITSENDDDWVNQTLERNGFASKQGEWYRGAIRDSESFVLVDPQTAMWSSEPAYDGHSGIVAIFDQMTQLPIWACKLWSVSEPADVSTDAEDKDETSVIHLVVYQQDKITYWKGQNDSGSVDEVKVEGNGLKTLDRENGYVWDLGVIPLVQFANKRDNYTPYGESELRPVVPLQDIVNSTLYDMSMASKLSAFKIYWSIGMAIDKDGIVPGSVINLVLKDKSGNVLTSLTEEAANYLKAIRVGEFGTTDMSQYTNQLDKLEREISQVSATPVYGITAQGNLSGEALKQLESGLVGKIIRFQNENENAIKMLLKMTAEIQRTYEVNKTFGARFTQKIAKFMGFSTPPKPPAELNISVNWKSPEIINISVQLQALSQLRRDNPGLWSDEWYRERIGALLAMSSTQITEEGDKAKMEQVNAFDSLIGGGGNIPIV